MSNPYVATPQGYARKIGPKSKYALNDDTPAYGSGIGPQGAQSSGNSRSSFEGQTKVGTPFPKIESRFAMTMREARDQADQKGSRATEAAATDSAANAKKAEEEEKKKKKADPDNGLSGVARRMRRSARRFATLPAAPWGTSTAPANARGSASDVMQ